MDREAWRAAIHGVTYRNVSASKEWRRCCSWKVGSGDKCGLEGTQAREWGYLSLHGQRHRRPFPLSLWNSHPSLLLEPLPVNSLLLSEASAFLRWFFKSAIKKKIFFFFTTPASWGHGRENRGGLQLMAGDPGPWRWWEFLEDEGRGFGHQLPGLKSPLSLVGANGENVFTCLVGPAAAKSLQSCPTLCDPTRLLQGTLGSFPGCL